MEKNEARKICSQVRYRISDREQKDAKIRERALTLARSYKKIFIYVSMGSEVDTHEIIAHLRSDEKEIFVPFTHGSSMHAVRLKSDACLKSVDCFGNLPGINGPYIDGQAELIFVPLLGFDECCHRIGYGAGCYDKYFEKFPQGLKVGLSYDEQFCSFEKAEHDFPLDMLVTPTRVYRRNA